MGLRRLLLAAGHHLAQRIDELAKSLLRAESTGLLGAQELLSLLLNLLRRDTRRLRRLGDRRRYPLAEASECVADHVEAPPTILPTPVVRR